MVSQSTLSSGSETERITLAQTTGGAVRPAPWTKQTTTSNATRLEAAYGRSEVGNVSEIAPALQTGDARALAADFLFGAALAYLNATACPMPPRCAWRSAGRCCCLGKKSG